MQRIENRLVRYAAVVAMTLVIGACMSDARADSPDSAESAEFRRVINVVVAEVEPVPFRDMIRIPATVRAEKDVLVSAEEAGVVRELLVARGATVREGAPIARIDSRVLGAQVDEAEARAALARETWQRRKRLFEDEQVGSELAYLEARYQAEQAEAALNTLRERLDRTVVRAPISGIVDERSVEVGTMVSAGTQIARVVQIDPIKITAGIPERFARDVNVGSRSTVTFDVHPGQRFDGRVSFAGSTVNPRNRTFEIEIVIPNPGGTIKPEMVANLEVTRRDLEDAIVVPQEALVRVENGFVVFVAETDGENEVARVRPVVTANGQRNRVVVTEGLEAGERLIVIGQNQVADGDLIRVTQAGGEGE